MRTLKRFLPAATQTLGATRVESGGAPGSPNSGSLTIANRQGRSCTENNACTAGLTLGVDDFAAAAAVRSNRATPG